MDSYLLSHSQPHRHGAVFSSKLDIQGTSCRLPSSLSSISVYRFGEVREFPYSIACTTYGWVAHSRLHTHTHTHTHFRKWSFWLSISFSMKLSLTLMHTRTLTYEHSLTLSHTPSHRDLMVLVREEFRDVRLQHLWGRWDDVTIIFSFISSISFLFWHSYFCKFPTKSLNMVNLVLPKSYFSHKFLETERTSIQMTSSIPYLRARPPLNFWSPHACFDRRWRTMRTRKDFFTPPWKLEKSSRWKFPMIPVIWNLSTLF